MLKNANEKKEVDASNRLATQFVLSIAVIYILIGALLLFVPQIQITTLCYLLCSVLIIAGIVLIVRYFMVNSYQNINEYGFSVGVFTVILGMCALVRVEEVSKSFILCIGIAMLMTSVIKLQNALDLKNLREKTWIIMLSIALVFVVCAIIIIIHPFAQETTLYGFTFRIMIIDGILSLLSNLYLNFIIRKTNKKEIEYTENQTEPIEVVTETKEALPDEAND
ncbi:MAG: HdeD family acid-resistance protein [Velocimicrobium sp.]